jgi:hypothetical protein
MISWSHIVDHTKSSQVTVTVSGAIASDRHLAIK